MPDRSAPSLLDLLYSTKRGHAFGWNYRTMPEIAHRLALEKKGHLRWFIHALRTYDYYRAFKVADCSGKSKEKATRYEQERLAGSQEFSLDVRQVDFLRFLFPELFLKKPLEPALEPENPFGYPSEARGAYARKGSAARAVEKFGDRTVSQGAPRLTAVTTLCTRLHSSVCCGRLHATK